MLRHKNIGRICCGVLAATLILTIGYMGAGAMGLLQPAHAMGYEGRLFDTGSVHSLDIVMDDWDSFIDTCENEEYAVCTILIDGEKFSNVAIRAKGNTSLSSVAQYGNDRYSFKVEFDHYDDSITYHGLDKLSLNNLIQDNTFMKDYVTYTMMNEMGAAAPLCSYVYVTVNGEDWGLYLAVEGVEEAFMQRNYGADYGEMYKPDSMSFGGGRGNGMDFDLNAFAEEAGFDFSGNMGNMPEMGERPDMDKMPEMGGGFGGFGMGSSDVKLQYIDDDPASYSNIFNNAVTDVSDADQTRLIEALKKLSAGDVSAVDVEKVIRYFVVHDFVRNDDSYTGMMIHNYYLYEEDGVLSMVPWDYNLAFGGFSGGNATSQVNSPIDTPVSGGVSDRPMVAWIFENEEYTQLYHEVYAELAEKLCVSGRLDSEISRVADMIAPYVEKDVNAFATYDEFTAGVAALREFVELRGQSVKGQLDGTIPSTSEGQSEDSSAFIDASSLTLSDMGSMGMGGGGFGGIPGDMGNMPEGFSMSGNMGDMFGGFSMTGNTEEAPEGFSMPGNMGEMPEGFSMPDNMGNMFGGFGAPFEMPEATEEPTAATTVEAEAASDLEAASVPEAADEQPRRGGSEFSFPGGSGGTYENQADNSSLWLMVSCAAVLAVGIAVAALFKGRN